MREAVRNPLLHGEAAPLAREEALVRVPLRAGPGAAGAGLPRRRAGWTAPARRRSPSSARPPRRRWSGRERQRGGRRATSTGLRGSGTRRRRRSAPTPADLAAFLAFLASHLGGEPDLAALGRLSQADLRAWLAHEAADGTVNATRARHLSAVRSLFRYLARHHGVANPAPGLLGRPRARPPVPRALTEAEAATLVADIAEQSDDRRWQARDAALFTLLYGAGLRIAEALALDVGAGRR